MKVTMQELLDSLEKWESFDNHDIGPGLHFSQAWLQLFGDGSGNVIVELNTVPKIDNVDLSKLLSVLGVEGRMEKPLKFATLKEAMAILQKPLILSYDR